MSIPMLQWKPTHWESSGRTRWFCTMCLCLQAFSKSITTELLQSKRAKQQGAFCVGRQGQLQSFPLAWDPAKQSPRNSIHVKGNGSEFDFRLGHELFLHMWTDGHSLHMHTWVLDECRQMEIRMFEYLLILKETHYICK